MNIEDLINLGYTVSIDRSFKINKIQNGYLLEIIKNKECLYFNKISEAIKFIVKTKGEEKCNNY